MPYKLQPKPARFLGQQNNAPLRCGVWAMVMCDGDYTILYDHGNAHWSASYYIDAGDADSAQHPGSGLIMMTDPRGSIRHTPGGLKETHMSQFTIRPRTGRLAIFPGWLKHFLSSFATTYYLGVQPYN